jgi:hypothetical protein
MSTTFLKGEYCKFCIDENISLILVHCLREYVGTLLGFLGVEIDVMCNQDSQQKDPMRFDPVALKNNHT